MIIDQNLISEWVRVILTAFLGTADSEVQIIHISRVIIAIYIGIIIFPHIDNTQSTGHNLLQKKDIKKTQKTEGTH